jgi:O-antigen polymerase
MLVCVLICTITGAASQTSGLIKSSVKFDRTIGGMEPDIRWKIYKLSWDLFTESPVVGHGLGSFQKVFQDKRREYQQEGTLHLGSEPRFSHPHNEMFLWLVEGGIVSVSGIVLAAIVTFVQLIKIGWRRGCGYAALLIPITLHTQVELPFYTSNTHWLLLLFLLFITHQHRRKKILTSGLSIAANRLIPLSFVCLALFSSWSLIGTLKANSDLVKYFSGGASQPELLSKPISSLYFREHALFLSYRHNMIIGLRNRDAKPVLEFINYTEKLLQKSPAEMYYYSLITAYHVVGENESRDKRLEEALYTYEDSSRLKLLKQKYQQEKQIIPN